jgi:lantibiotic modifying enzyme
MMKNLNEKLKVMRATREKCEELAMTMSFLEGGDIKPLKLALKRYYEDHENEELRTDADKLVLQLIEMADKNRKNEGMSGILGSHEEERKIFVESDENRFGHINWVHKLIDLTRAENQDIWVESTIPSLEELRSGHIIDA